LCYFIFQRILTYAAARRLRGFLHLQPFHHYPISPLVIVTIVDEMTLGGHLTLGDYMILGVFMTLGGEMTWW
jgi:hypothetical protein